MLLYGKLQDGLWTDLVSRAPAISGAQSYQELCIAAKNEERWLAELKRKKQYERGGSSQNQANKTNQQHQPPQLRKDNQRGNPTFCQQTICYICDSPKQLAWDC